MISYDNRTLWDYIKVLFTCRGSVYRHIVFSGILYAAWGVCCSLLAKKFGDSIDKGIGFSPVTHTILSPAISFLLVYRVQLAYGRYWEARQLLGGLATSVRELVAHVISHVDYGRKSKESQGYRINIIRLTLAFSRYNNAILRSGGKEDDAANNFPYLRDLLLDEEREALKKCPRPRTTVLGAFLRESVGRAEEAGFLKQPHLQLAVQAVNSIMSNASGMQRIMSTPVPIAFTQALEVGLFVFTVTLPFVFIPIWKSEKEPYAMPIIMFFCAVILYGLKNTSYEIEDPFGDDDNDLPLIESQAAIETDVRELLRQDSTRLELARHVMNEEECATVLETIKENTGVGLALVSRRKKTAVPDPTDLLNPRNLFLESMKQPAGAAAASSSAVALKPIAKPHSATGDVEAPAVTAVKPLDPA